MEAGGSGAPLTERSLKGLAPTLPGFVGVEGQDERRIELGQPVSDGASPLVLSVPDQRSAQDGGRPEACGVG